MLKLLIVSPHFPPNNTPDMQRVRMMLPFFAQNEIEAIILAVESNFTEAPLDDYILKSVPEHIVVKRVKAFKSQFSRKIGLGNLGIRAFKYLRKEGEKIIKEFKPDLIFFSTTVFVCMPLGRIWKKKFKIPFIIDMQDPWRNDYYLTLPKKNRPKKFWFAYRLNKFLEKITIPYVSGVISVNEAYIKMFEERYNGNFKAKTIVMPLGAPQNDFDLMNNIEIKNSLKFDSNYINAVYTGVVPDNMKFSIEAILYTLKKYNSNNFQKIRMYFIGTNYAPKAFHKDQVMPIAKNVGVEEYVIELTERKPYFEAIKIMKEADFLVLPGTFDDNYTASKIFPFILSQKNVLAVFNENSELKGVIESVTNLNFIGFNRNSEIENLVEKIYSEIVKFVNGFELKINFDKFEKFSDKEMTKIFKDFAISIIK